MLEVQYSQARACFIFLFEELPCTLNFCEWELNGISQVWELCFNSKEEHFGLMNRVTPYIRSRWCASSLSPNPPRCGINSMVYGAEIPSVWGDFSFWKIRKWRKATLPQAVLQVFVYRILSEHLFLQRCKGLCGVEAAVTRNWAKKKFTSKYLQRHKPWFP